MYGSINQSPEQIARDNIDKQLHATGWAVQDKDKIDWDASVGIAVREYQTDVGPADYVLFVERRPVGIIEAKKKMRGTELHLMNPKRNLMRKVISNIWIEKVSGESPKSELVALVSLLRRVSGIDDQLTAYDKTVDRNFQKWVFEKQAGALKFNEEQMNWLRMMKEHIATSVHIEVEDLDYTPFDAIGGRGKMFQLFGTGMNAVISEMNAAVAV